MRLASRSLPSILLPALVFVAAVLELGCFKPNIADGGFICATTGVKCPEGFMCFSDNRCYRPGHFEGGVGGTGGASGTGGPGGTGGIGGSGGTGGTGGTGPCVTFPPFQPPDGGCTPQAGGLCDPVCQTGNCTGCRRKCSVVMSSSMEVTCNQAQIPSSGTFRKELEFCDQVSLGQSSQTDTCGPGLVCMMDGCADTRCYKFCRTDRDCPNSVCDRDGPGGSMVCDVPFMDSCNPVGPTSGCPVGQSCYISTKHPDRTTCDCTLGSLLIGEQCDRSRECLDGLVCVQGAGGGAFRCRQTCRLGGNDCAGGAPCQMYRGSTTNITNPTFGFCNN